MRIKIANILSSIFLIGAIIGTLSYIVIAPGMFTPYIDYKETKEIDIINHRYLYDISVYHWYHCSIVKYERASNLTEFQLNEFKKRQDTVSLLIKNIKN